MPSTITNADVRGNPYRVRDPNNASLTEIWLVSSIVTVLGIRLYLWLTGYPQVGGDTLHIAHMLWGGLFMVVAFAMVMLFANAVWKPIAALVGGIGFGTFIDELGKFITKDNDYFFEPTISIMYGIFIALYLLARYLDRKRQPTAADHLFLAVQGVQWQAIGKLDKRRQEIALEHLDRSGIDSPFVDEVRSLLENADLIDSASQSRIYAARQKAVDLYWQIVGNAWFRRLILGFFVIRMLQIFGAGLISYWNDTLDPGDGISWTEWLALGTGFVSGLLAVFAIVQMLRGKRIPALQALALSALVSLFFGQFFAFAAEQFAALTGLVLDLGVLGAIRLALSAENDRHHEEQGGEDPERGSDVSFRHRGEYLVSAQRGEQTWIYSGRSLSTYESTSRILRRNLVQMLRGLSDNDWACPTACGGWCVHDVALHIAGGLLANVSRRRDRHPGNFLDFSTDNPGLDDDARLVDTLNAWNDIWVVAARRISPALTIDLIDMAGDDLDAYFATLDLAETGDPIGWAGPDPAPVGIDVAREYTEVWSHAAQIREATGRDLIDDPALFAPVLATFAHGLPHALKDVDRPAGTALRVVLTGGGGGRWWASREDAGWRLAHPGDRAPDASVTVDGETAWRLATKGIDPDDARARARVEGDAGLVDGFFRLVAILA